MGGAADHLRRLDAGVPGALRPEPRLWVSLVAEHARRDGARRVERGGVRDWRRRECDLGGADAGDGCCGQVVGEGGAGGVCGGGTVRLFLMELAHFPNFSENPKIKIYGQSALSAADSKNEKLSASPLTR